MSVGNAIPIIMGAAGILDGEAEFEVLVLGGLGQSEPN